MKRKSIFRALLITMLVSVSFASVAMAAPMSDLTCEQVITHAQQQIEIVQSTLTRLESVGAPQPVIELFQIRLQEEKLYWQQRITEACA